MGGKKVFTGRVKLDKSNYDEAKNLYTAETAYEDWEVVKFTYSPEGGITQSWIEYIGRVNVEWNERPTNIKEKQTDKWIWIYGCVNFDADRRCNMRKWQSADAVPTFTISFSKPEGEKTVGEVFKDIETESNMSDDKKEVKEEPKKEAKKDDDLPF